MREPVQNRNMAALNPVFLSKLKPFLAAAKKAGFRVLVYETTRTLERQKWLFGQGRTRPGQIVTYTLDSLHRYKCAVDLVPLDRAGRANWAGYRALYAAVTPSKFGLELLSFERPHLQIAGGQATAHRLGITPI